METSISSRIERASAILGITSDNIKSCFTLNKSVSDELIDSIITSLNESEIVDALTAFFGSDSGVKAPIIAATKVLKRPVADSKAEYIKSESTLEKILQASKPIANWSDEEVLLSYLESESQDLEFELNKRSKGHRFVVLIGNQKPLKNVPSLFTPSDPNTMDIKATLAMLKRARKEEIPAVYKTADNEIIRVFRIEEYHPENRERFVSPLRPTSILFDGYCSECGLNFSKVDMTARQFLRLIYEKEGKQSKTTEAGLIEVASHGIDALFDMYPELVPTWDEKERNGSLPKLKVYESPTTKGADPFNSTKRVY